MKITNKEIGKEYSLLSPKGSQNKRLKIGVFTVQSVENGKVTGDVRHFLVGCLAKKTEVCKFVFNESGKDIDEKGLLVINGCILEKL